MSISATAGIAMILSNIVFCDTVEQATKVAENPMVMSELVKERNELNQPVCGYIKEDVSMAFVTYYTVNEYATHRVSISENDSYFVTFVEYGDRKGTIYTGYVVSTFLLDPRREDGKKFFLPRIDS